MATLLLLIAFHPVAASASEDAQAVERIGQFVRSWLIDEDTKSASLALSVGALSNEAMLSEACAGYSGSPRARFDSFLADFSKRRLDLSRVRRAARSVKPINDVGRDGFLVIHLDRNKAAKLVDDLEVQTFLLRHLPTGRLYTSFVGFEGGGVVYFIWIGSAANVRIYHAGMLCM